MSRYFTVAEKKACGNPMTQFNTQTNSAEVVKWDIDAENIPHFEEGRNYVEIKAAEDMTIKSIWGGFAGAANVGVNVVANKINALFGSAPAQDASKADYDKSFKPTAVYTGVKVHKPDDEVLVITNTVSTMNKGLMLVAGNVVTDNEEEVILYYYNMFPGEVKIYKGDTLAIGVFQKVAVGNTDNTENKVSLDKN